MAIIYRQGANDDLAPLKSVGIDDDSATAWWGGAQKCFVQVALATLLTVTALSTAVAQEVQLQSGEQDDVPAGSLVNLKVDDDSATAWWAGVQACFASVHSNTVQNTTALSTLLSEYEEQGEQSDVPAGALYGQADEDFWSLALLPAPVPAGLYQHLPVGDPEEIPAGSLFGQDDEDLWILQEFPAPVAASVFQRLPYLPDPEELPANSLKKFTSPDEDYWQNRVAPVAASAYLQLPLAPDPADSDFATPVVTVPPDEDFWANPAAPTAAKLYQPLPLGDPEEIPAGSLFGQPDEDFWRNPTAPVAATLQWPQPFSFDVQEPAGSLFGQYDEDFWVSGVAPVAGTVYRSPLLPDPEEISAGSLVKFQSPDEDFWSNPTRPVAATLYQQLPYLFEQSDFIPPTQPIQDEDFWQNRVAPVPSALYRSPLFSDPEEVPAGSLKKFTSAEEEYWVRQFLPAPVPASLYQVLPLGDPEEIPAGSLSGQADEDFWQNPVAPVQAALYRTPVFRDPEELPALKKFTSPDEDYWQNRVAPVAASLYQSLPYLYDAVDSGNLVAPVVAAQLGGGIAWPYPELSERHWSAPPSSELPIKKGKKKPASVAGTARPSGLSAEATLGNVRVSGSARAKAEGQNARLSLGAITVAVAATLQPVSESHRVQRHGAARLGRVKARGIRNPSDEELLWILGEIE